MGYLPKSRTFVSIDPGGTSGIVTFVENQSRPDPFKFYQLGPKDHHAALWKMLAELDPALIIYERFHHRPFADARMKLDLIANEYIGVAKVYCTLTKKDYHAQEASAAKGLWTDSKIKTLGLWLPSMPHAMDALRHMLYYLTVDLRDTSYVQRLRRPAG